MDRDGCLHFCQLLQVVPGDGNGDGNGDGDGDGDGNGDGDPW